MLWFVSGYLAGSVPVGYLWVRYARGIDVRRSGSGNVGATNVARVLESRAAGLVVLLLDVFKGWGPAFVASLAARLTGSSPLTAGAIAGGGAILGHCWPVWLGFRGGKGVATGLGVALALIPLSAALALAVFLAVLTVTRYVSAASCAAALSLPVWAFLGWTGSPIASETETILLSGFSIGAAALVSVRHRANFERIRRGTEPRIRGWRNG